MRLRREQVVLVLTLALLAWMSRGLTSASKSIRGRKKASSPELIAFPAPPVATALPDEPSSQRSAGLKRELFAPPSDTRPLPPLEFQAPPSAPLLVLRPPSVPGPAPAVFGRFLRMDLPEYDAPDLFGEAEALEEDLALESAFEPALQDVHAQGTGAGELAPESLTTEERLERIKGWKQVYDWIRIGGGELKFGQIRNPDRFALAGDARPVEFVEFNPVDGTERFAAIRYERERVEDLGFADTPANRMELRRRALGSALTAGGYEDALLFAFGCIENRLESSRALDIAEEVFRMAEAIANEDPAPRIGIARCYEAGFKFEAAFDEYHGLLDSGYARDPRVLVPLALLEARFRMYASAEERLRESERYARTSWLVQASLGRFLLEHGRIAEAVEHLRLANQYEPSRAELKTQRARMRVDLASALIALGELDEAATWMDKALQADEGNARAHAGQVAIRVLEGRGAREAAGAANGMGRADDGQGADAGFEGLLASGLAKLLDEDLGEAKQDLLLAAQADPLRAGKAWRALSWLAEVSGHPEDALRYIALASENDPTDAWTLYQYGRVLGQRDDLEDALEAFRRALDQELDFPEALAAMGELEFRRGNHEDAERYFERALTVDGGLVRVHDLRGVNLLELDRVPEATEAFEAALVIDSDLPSALAGAAWCSYRRGDADEAIIRLRELDDNRRDLSADDPFRVYAQGQIERLTDHLEKVSWTDRFERRSLRNNWTVEESAGPTVALVEGEVLLSGVFKERGRSRLWQVKPAGDFVALEARLTVRSGNSARAGIFVSRERTRRAQTRIESEITLSRHPLEGVPQVQILSRAGGAPEYVSAPAFDWPVGEAVTLRVERIGESGAGLLRILLDGFPILDEQHIQALGSTTTELRIGVFVEGDAGREADVIVDDVEIVYRERR